MRKGMWSTLQMLIMALIVLIVLGALIAGWYGYGEQIIGLFKFNPY